MALKLRASSPISSRRPSGARAARSPAPMRVAARASGAEGIGDGPPDQQAERDGHRERAEPREHHGAREGGERLALERQRARQLHVPQRGSGRPHRFGHGEVGARRRLPGRPRRRRVGAPRRRSSCPHGVNCRLTYNRVVPRGRSRRNGSSPYIPRRVAGILRGGEGDDERRGGARALVRLGEARGHQPQELVGGGGVARIGEHRAVGGEHPHPRVAEEGRGAREVLQGHAAQARREERPGLAGPRRPRSRRRKSRSCRTTWPRTKTTASTPIIETPSRASAA